MLQKDVKDVLDRITVKLITTDTIIPSISEPIDQSDIKLLNDTYQNTQLHDISILYRLKVADVNLFLNFSIMV